MRRTAAAVALLVMIPVLITGGFFSAGWDSHSRLKDLVQAAIVNLDEPVTINDQYMPLGRQLTAALVDSDRAENLDWQLTSLESAEAGLADGSYAAMVVIPKEFSAYATSFAGDVADVTKASVIVETSPVAGIADAEVGRLVSLAAAASLNETLTSGYLDNVYQGFNDMKDAYGELADGSKELADGAEELADGLEEAADGSQLAVEGGQELADGARKLADGLGTMAKETKSMPAQLQELADGTKQYTDGVNQILDQVLPYTEYLKDIEPAAEDVAAAAAKMNDAVQAFASDVESIENSPYLEDAVATARAAAKKADCPSAIEEAGLCDEFREALADAAADAARQGVIEAGKELSKALNRTDDKGNSILTIAEQIAAEAKKLPEEAKIVSEGIESLKLMRGAGTQLAEGTQQLADEMPKLTNGIQQTATGADQLADGVQLYVDGIGELSSGLGEAASGSGELADGARQMADGIAEGKDEIPTYSDDDRAKLTSAVATPVSTDGMDALADANLGWGTVLLVLCLWLGALACNTVIRPTRRTILASNATTAQVIWEQLRPGLLTAGVQSALLIGIAQAALQLPADKFAALAGLLLLAGVAFALANYALAWFGNWGRLVSLACAVLFATSALTGALPGFFGAVKGFLPLTPVLNGIRGVVTGAAGLAGNTAGSIGWLVIAAVACGVCVAKARATTLDRLLATA
ncbi:MAG: YhgE/Pip domain-containing protein [Propionibacteriaceae bacterium]|nr:YhgE/Pip domain-containing protein [Propionibacteriaceae bacterium]